DHITRAVPYAPRLPHTQLPPSRNLPLLHAQAPHQPEDETNVDNTSTSRPIEALHWSLAGPVSPFPDRSSAPNPLHGPTADLHPESAQSLRLQAVSPANHLHPAV